MSETAVLSQAEARAPEDLIFEQRLFTWSPFGTGLTALLIFLLFAGSFALTVTAQGQHLFQFVHDGIVLPSDTRGALVISLLVATALGMQRYVRLKDVEDVARDNSVLRECMMQSYAHSYRPGEQSALGKRLVAATTAGVVLGVCIDIGLNRHSLLSWPHVAPVFYWFLFAEIVLCTLFTRGVELTRTGARAMRTFIEQFLSIDLLRIDQLSIVGRSAARTSLVWFAVSAVSCLFFVSGGLSIGFALGFTLSCAAIGIAMFVLTLTKVHHHIKSAKAAELERIRGQIDGVRHEAHSNADASLRLQGLIAYEKRIEGAPEWPFDQTTAMRLAASALILTVPWFGQAIAQSLIERLDQVVH